MNKTLFKILLAVVVVTAVTVGVLAYLKPEWEFWLKLAGSLGIGLSVIVGGIQKIWQLGFNYALKKNPVRLTALLTEEKDARYPGVEVYNPNSSPILLRKVTLVAKVDKIDEMTKQRITTVREELCEESKVHLRESYAGPGGGFVAGVSKARIESETCQNFHLDCDSDLRDVFWNKASASKYWIEVECVNGTVITLSGKKIHTKFQERFGEVIDLVDKAKNSEPKHNFKVGDYVRVKGTRKHIKIEWFWKQCGIQMAHCSFRIDKEDRSGDYPVEQLELNVPAVAFA